VTHHKQGAQMNFLFFDTETTGLPLNYKAPYTDISNWPRIVQLSWLIANEDGTILKESDYIIKVDFPIPKEASQVHGITNLVAAKKGIIITEVLNTLLNDLNGMNHLICHNVNFDLTILQSELYRHNLHHQINIPTFCTMKNSTEYCKLPGNYGYKWPKLEELYSVCFNKKLENAHNAMADVRATYEVFYYLKKEKVFHNFQN
jgi:DNA polymerase-3 subunit alpha/DNA polymerase-3 subunit epsilon